MSQTPQIRSLYRRFLRELPTNTAAATSSKQPSTRSKSLLLSHPSPLQQRIRSSFSSSATKHGSPAEKAQEAEQLALYLASQRRYVTLIERYNKGLNMEEEERVRLSAKRVGMEMPEEWYGGGKN